MSTRLDRLKSQRESLEASLYSGAQSVRHGDKQLYNRSVEEIRKALGELDEAIAEEEGRRRSRVIYLVAVRGY